MPGCVRLAGAGMRGKVLSHDCGALPGPRLAEGRGCSFRYHRAARFFAADHVAQPLASRCVGFRIAPARGPPHLMQTWGCPPVCAGCWSWRCNVCGCSLGAARILGTREAARLWLCSQVANPRPVIMMVPRSGQTCIWVFCVWITTSRTRSCMREPAAATRSRAAAGAAAAASGCRTTGTACLRTAAARALRSPARVRREPLARARKSGRRRSKRAAQVPGPHPLVLLVHVRGVRPAR